MKLFGFGLFVTVVMLIAYAWLQGRYRAKITVINNANEMIESGEVDLCGEKFLVSQLESGQSESDALKVSRDCDYKVTARFSSGKTVSGRVGYVTPGIGSDDHLSITEEKIDLVPKRSQF
jgi:hypothetical protein